MASTPYDFRNQKYIIDILKIHMLKARYARLGDTKNWTEFRKCFADDFHCKVDGAPRATINDLSSYEVYSADEFVENASKMTSDIQPIHQLSAPEITLISETTASGIWSLHDYLIAPHCIFRGWGHYHDQYVKIGDQWKIQDSRLTRIRVEETWL